MLLPLCGANILTDEWFMQQALAEASQAAEDGDVPVGAVVVHRGVIIGRGRNQREQLQDPTAHAEMVAITAAASHVRSWRLTNCSLYVTIEPCVMCAAAIVQARIEKLVFGAEDPKAGGCGSIYTITDDPRLNHRVAVFSGLLSQECAKLVRDFFAAQRAAGKK